eukprot:jgi/Psemu1/32477/gm1.32477_g
MDFYIEDNSNSMSHPEDFDKHGIWCVDKDTKSERTFYMDYSNTDSSIFDDSDDSTCATASSSNATNSIELEVVKQDCSSRQEKLEDETTTRTHTTGPISSLSSILKTSSRYENASTTSVGAKCVQFGFLKIHEHPMEMGGAGVPGCGPSVTLGWNEQSSMVIESVVAYEIARESMPRKGIEMLHPKGQRIGILLKAGYSMNQILRCSDECEQIRRQRTKTVKRVTFERRTKSTFRKLLVWKHK